MSQVLVVDDNEHNREYARQVLAGRWRVRSAEGGQEALDLVAADPPLLVLLDLSMPEVDGWEVLRQLKADQRTQEIPVIACSAHAMAGDRERGLQAGFSEYLTKPYRAEQLLACVSAFLGEAAPGAGGLDDEDDDWGDDAWSLDDDAWNEEGE
ncbi:MAG: response regulator [Planctomycetota bacterium]